MTIRALHVIPAVAPRYGGPSEAVVALCRALDDAGVETAIAATDADGPGRLDVPLGVPVEWRGARAIFFRRERSEALKVSRPLARWLDGAVGAWDVVHVHAVFSHACLAAGRACRRGGVPYVVRPLGTLVPWSLSQKRWRKRALWPLAARLLDGAAAIHYTSEAEREAAPRPSDRAKGAVVPLGVDLAPVARTGDDGDPYVLFLSRIHPKKRLEDLIDAVAALPDPRWRLVVAGDGEPAYVAALAARARAALGVRAEFRGWVDGAAKREALAGAALLALPSIHENFGVAAVEALAAGVPVVVSAAVDVAPAVAEAGAGWVTEAGAGPLAAVLAEAAADGEERRRRGRAGAALARERYAWPAVARRVAALYAEVAPARRGTRAAVAG